MWKRMFVICVAALLVVAGCDETSPDEQQDDEQAAQQDDDDTEESTDTQQESHSEDETAAAGGNNPPTGDASNPTTGGGGPSDIDPPGGGFDTHQQLPNVVEQVMPSVVGITTELELERGLGAPGVFGDIIEEFGSQLMPGDEFEDGFEGMHRQEDVGSGVLVDEDGIVLTNHHVIEHAENVIVSLDDGREFETETIGTDPESDMAALELQDAPDDLEALEFGDSDALRLGETVIAIGNPFGLSGTVTTGIISAKGRADVGLLDYEDFIQTDAAINPGNSGGALLNLDGELIGINTAILTRSGGYQGVGFAIPSNMAHMVKTGLVEDGYVDRGWLGVAIEDLTEELAESLDVDDELEGAVVVTLHPESPAADGGIERQDVITHIDGERVHNSQELHNSIGLRPPGEQIELTYHRGQDSYDTTVTLESREQAELVVEDDFP